MRNLYAFIFILVLGCVESQLNADQVYELLSNRIHIENVQLRTQLRKLEEKFDAKESNMNKKIDALHYRIDLLDRDKTGGKEIQDNAKDEKQDANGMDKLENIQNQMILMRHSFKNEKMYVRRNLKSLMTNNTGAFIDNQSIIKQKTERNERDLRQVNETVVHLEQVIMNENHEHSKVEKELKDKIQNISKIQKIIEDSCRVISKQLRNLETQLDNLTNGPTLSSQEILDKTEKCNIDQENLELRIKRFEHLQSLQDQKIQGNTLSVNQLMNRPETPKVHFFADVHDNNVRLSTGAKVVFNFIVSQQGDAYNEIEGIFTCPVSGVYLFSVVLANNNPTNTWLTGTLKMDSKKAYLNVLSRNFHSYEHDQGSNLAIVRLSEGQKVWVELLVQNNKTAEIQKNFSSFAGVLLYT